MGSARGISFKLGDAGIGGCEDNQAAVAAADFAADCQMYLDFPEVVSMKGGAEKVKLVVSGNRVLPNPAIANWVIQENSL